MVTGLLHGRCPAQHVPGCPVASPVARTHHLHSGPARRRVSLHRTAQGVRPAAVAIETEQTTAADATPSTSYSNGAGSKEDLTYAMDHASNDVLYKRFFELLDGNWGDINEGDRVTGVVLS